MKLIQIDGYQRDTVADVLLVSGLDREEGSIVLEAFIEAWGSDSIWFCLVGDDYRLSRGMEDLV